MLSCGGEKFYRRSWCNFYRSEYQHVYLIYLELLMSYALRNDSAPTVSPWHWLGFKPAGIFGKTLELFWSLDQSLTLSFWLIRCSWGRVYLFSRQFLVGIFAVWYSRTSWESQSNLFSFWTFKIKTKNYINSSIAKEFPPQNDYYSRIMVESCCIKP